MLSFEAPLFLCSNAHGYCVSDPRVVLHHHCRLLFLRPFLESFPCPRAHPVERNECTACTPSMRTHVPCKAVGQRVRKQCTSEMGAGARMQRTALWERVCVRVRVHVKCTLGEGPWVCAGRLRHLRIAGTDPSRRPPRTVSAPPPCHSISDGQVLLDTDKQLLRWFHDERVTHHELRIWSPALSVQDAAGLNVTGAIGAAFKAIPGFG